MTPIIRSLHHVTATVDNAQEDLDFYRKILGMRLVKKTVNFDSHSVYHFYYGNEHGTPGTLMTTFPYQGYGVRVGVHGRGQVTGTAFSVPKGSLPVWQARLRAAGIGVREGERFGENLLTLLDPSGLVIELVANGRDEREPWVAEGYDEPSAVRGLFGVTLSIQDLGPSLDLLKGILGFEVVQEDEGRTRLAVGGDLPGHTLEMLHTPEAPRARNGIGTVHHVAMAIDDEDALVELREELVGHGIKVTEVRDRNYFRSIYFREPGGVLYEVATIPPGFTLDEDLASLGCALKLPEWEEPNRPEIERSLATVTH